MTSQRNGRLLDNLMDRNFNSDLLFTAAARSALDCARRCGGTHGCLTFTYTAGASSSTSCRGHKSLMTSASTFTASPETRVFSFACDASDLQADFVYYPVAQLNHNNLHFSFTTAAECKALCLADSRCRTIDVRVSDSACAYQSVTALDKPGDWIAPAEDHNHYQIMCA
ncbi:hypothetical protein BaRGS_00005490 [Batillaria attramentaria]|uniref:Apple domain-containing protein n=1 Tax=Batillaria attramentaria TaxID=370345 RepID=A0ABD0LUA4_9CAEN